MKIQKIESIVFKLKTHTPFKANYGEFNERKLMLIKLYTNEGIGWGSCPSLGPYYSEETLGSIRYLLKRYVGPLVIGKDIEKIDDFSVFTKNIRGNKFALAGIELALWDIFSKINKKPLHKYLGGEKKKIECGNSIGMVNEKPKKLLKKIENSLKKGYKRIKIKITPGWDILILEKIRNTFGNINLSVDCNAGYTYKDIDIFKKLDKFNLQMIEQPLYYNDLYKHSLLQKQINTPICLDESIQSYKDAVNAIEMGSCKIINIKPARVGGIKESIKIHNICKKNNIPVWCGGMHESGIGIGFNLAVASLTGFTLPADIVPPEEYFIEDIINSNIILDKEGFIKLNNKIGLCYEINKKKLNDCKIDSLIIY